MPKAVRNPSAVAFGLVLLSLFGCGPMPSVSAASPASSRPAFLADIDYADYDIYCEFSFVTVSRTTARMGSRSCGRMDTETGEPMRGWDWTDAGFVQAAEEGLWEFEAKTVYWAENRLDCGSEYSSKSERLECQVGSITVYLPK